MNSYACAAREARGKPLGEIMGYTQAVPDEQCAALDQLPDLDRVEPGPDQAAEAD